MAPVSGSFRRSHGAIPMWCVQRTSDRTIACMLEMRGANGCSLAVTFDGEDVAAHHYPSTADAVSHASVLLERLTSDGWTLVTSRPPFVLH
jgi:hypothetical protein